jgi:hypothetical protein
VPQSNDPELRYRNATPDPQASETDHSDYRESLIERHRVLFAVGLLLFLAGLLLGAMLPK